MNLTDVEVKNSRDVLENGLTVVTVEMPHIHTLELAVFVRAGLRFEDEHNNGISHFLEHMLFRGNREYPTSILLNREFEAIGRDLRASTLTEHTFFGFSPHPPHLDKAMELFAHFFREPTFPQIHLEREIILEEYQEDLNGEGVNVDIDNLACKLLYEGSPLAMQTIGTEETIRSIDVGMLRDYFKTHYAPQNMVLVGAGPVTHEPFLDLAGNHFSKLENGSRTISPGHFVESVVEEQKRPEFSFQYDSDSQVQLQVCFRGISYNDPDYYALSLINRAFDDGFSSRLQMALREDRGLVYSVECRVTTLSDIGTVDFDVTVRPEKLLRVAEILFNEIRRFLDSGVTEEELEHVKKRYFYDLESDRDDPYKQILRYGFSQLYSRDFSVEEEWDIVMSQTREDLMRVARKIFVSQKLNVICVGPLTDALQDELKRLPHSF